MKSAKAKKARPRPSAIVEAPPRPFFEGAKALKKSLDGLGFDRVEVVSGSTYRDSSTIIVCPNRKPEIHHRVVTSWRNLILPMNQKQHFIFCIGDEVGKAYDKLVQMILDHPELSQWKYLMTVEADNIIPPDAHAKLLESLNEFGFDAVSGIYFTKGDVNMPMAYGDPDKFRRTGELDFTPRDIRPALRAGHVMEVNGIAMGCSLYKMELLRQIEAPRFVSLQEYTEGKGVEALSQDLYFCKKARLAGKRFGVDLRVRVGHLDLVTGEVY